MHFVHRMRRGRPATAQARNEDRFGRIERMLEELIGARNQDQGGNGGANVPPPVVQPPVVPPPIVAPPLPNLSMKDFQRLKPPTFEGGISAQQLQNWVLRMEGIFEIEPCSETQKVVLAAFMLQGEARR